MPKSSRKTARDPQSHWRTQLSQQASYKTEIHELDTEMLNMREKSEMKTVLSVNMCRLEQPSLTFEAGPENVLNTASPGRPSSWILSSELMTPVRPTTGTFRTPEGAPVQYGPSPVTQQYNRQGDIASVLLENASTMQHNKEGGFKNYPRAFVYHPSELKASGTSPIVKGGRENGMWITAFGVRNLVICLSTQGDFSEVSCGHGKQASLCMLHW